jgi:hypothetical protein
MNCMVAACRRGFGERNETRTTRDERGGGGLSIHPTPGIDCGLFCSCGRAEEKTALTEKGRRKNNELYEYEEGS